MLIFLSLTLFLASVALGRPSDEDSKVIMSRSKRSALPQMPQAYRNICGLSGGRGSRSLKATPYIINGTCAPYGSFPWTVEFERKEGSLWLEHCGGTILTEDFILSAAHCFDDANIRDMRVVVGQGVLNVRDLYEETFEIERIESHREFDFPRGSFSNDIALIKIRRKPDGNGISFSEMVGPACLPESDTPQKAGTQCTISGWGTTDPGISTPSRDGCMRHASVPIVEFETCKSWYKNANVNLGHGTICAGYEDGGIDACVGDSGGPMACDAHGQYHVMGIVSFGRGCAEKKRPGIYTNVKHYLDWIDNTLSGMVYG